MLASENGEQWSANIQAGFASDSKLASRIVDAGNANRVLQELFFDIGTYVLALQGKTPSHDLPSNSKKRKLEHNTTNGSGRDAPAVLLECKDVSFQAPMRKKLRFECSCDVSDQRSGRIQLVNSTSGQLEYGIAAKDIAYAFCLPQPEKQARQQNIILMPASSAVDEVSEGVAETVVFTLNETPPAGALVQGGIKEDDTYVTVTQRVLHTLLAPFGKSVVRPDEGHFASSIVQPHRRGEKAYHVKAHLAAKEGSIRASSCLLDRRLIECARLPLLPCQWHLLRLQEACRLLSLQLDRVYKLYFSPATNLQSCCHSCRER